jgi:hypothetical protein
MSFPACFVAGGLFIGFLLAARREGLSGRISLVAFAAVVGISFLALALGPVAAQRCTAMESCWTAHFPDWSRPLLVPAWAITQTFEVCRYCLMPLGHAFAVFAGLGVAAMCAKRSERELAAVLLAPLALALAAALVHQYPYGGMRVEAFATPALCLLSAKGARDVIPRITRKSRLLGAVCLAAFVPPLLLTAYRVVEPWPRAATDAAAAYIIERRAAGDPIRGNFWEHEYYLRNEPSFQPWQGEFTSSELCAARVWVIHAAERAVTELPYPLPEGWEVASRAEFARTSVFELYRTSHKP